MNISFYFKCIFIWVLFLIFNIHSVHLFAQEKTEAEHKGFMFRFLTGPSQMNMSYTVPDRSLTKFQTKAITVANEIQIGRSATKNFILHLNLFWILPTSSNLKLVGSSNPILNTFDNEIQSNQIKNTQLYSSYAAGLGFTYYMPKNFYFSCQYRGAVFSRLENRISIEDTTLLNRIKALPGFGNATLNTPYTDQIGLLEGTGLGFTLGWEGLITNTFGMGVSFFYYVDWLKIRSFKDRRPYALGNNAMLNGFNDGAYNDISVQNLSSGSAQQDFIGLALSMTYN